MKNVVSSPCCSTKAFTLIEVTIAIGIISILILISIQSFNSARQQIAHQAAVTRVMKMIQKARNLAITSQLHSYATGDPAFWSGVAPAGYGIRITRSMNDDNLYGGSSCDPSTQADCEKTWRGYSGEVILFVDNRYTGKFGCADLDIPTHSEYEPYYDSVGLNLGAAENFCFTVDATEGKVISGADEIIEVYKIPEDIFVEINAIYAVTMIFEPPFGDVKIYANFTDQDIDTDTPENEQLNFASKQGAGGNPFWTTDQNTALVRLVSRYNENTSDTIYMNRIGGLPEFGP